MHIYKICSRSLWEEAKTAGIFRGSAYDAKDGFIHYSTAEQLTETARKHFAGQPDLVLLTIESDTLGDTLKFEPSRGGALFPHGYAPLPLSAVLEVTPYTVP